MYNSRAGKEISELPDGERNKGEVPDEGLTREVREELGIDGGWRNNVYHLILLT